MLPQELEEMLSGPGRLRFIIQPIVAIVLGIRDGRRDVIDHRPPYFFSILTGSQPRKDALRQGFTTAGVPLAIAIVLDGILQYIILGSVRIWHAVVIGAVLIALPYITARGFTNRLSTRRTSRDTK